MRPCLDKCDVRARVLHARDVIFFYVFPSEIKQPVHQARQLPLPLSPLVHVRCFSSWVRRLG
jgi:hypothetical protein